MYKGGKKIIDARKRLSLIFFCLFVSIGFIPDASAITIVTHFLEGSAPSNAVGKGNLPDIVNAAARIWESAYSDSFTLNLYCGWAAVGHAGTHTVLQRDTLKREISGMILINNNGSAAFYLDPTPDSNEEYGRPIEESQSFGSGSINVARVFSNPRGEAVGRIDLLSVVLHEIGHALGLSAENPIFVAQSSNGVINISRGFALSGSVIPLARNHSGVAPHFDAAEIRYGSLMSGVNGDERRMPSELDILANAQLSGFTFASSSPVASLSQAERTFQQLPN
jgi:hypothetical protein